MADKEAEKIGGLYRQAMMAGVTAMRDNSEDISPSCNEAKIDATACHACRVAFKRGQMR